MALLCGPFLAWLTNWFRRESAKTYRVTREKVALVIVHFVESMGGIRAVQARPRLVPAGVASSFGKRDDCHPERSEGSHLGSAEIPFTSFEGRLRCAQNDTEAKSPENLATHYEGAPLTRRESRRY